MARRPDSTRIKEWEAKIKAANRVYDDWDKKFDCKTLWKYVQGFQWADGSGDEYTINKFFPTVHVQEASLLFHYPRVVCKPRPNRIDDPGTNAEARAQLREDTLNTFIQNRRVHFKHETDLALKEHFPRYGIVEVGYTADFIDNPNKGKPVLDKENNPVKDDYGADLLQPEQILERESIFIKRIPATHFRVSMNNKNILSQCDWCGYYEWHYPGDLKANPRYKNTSSIKASAQISNEYVDTMHDADQYERESKKDMVKVWKIWDIRAKKRCVFIESMDKYLLEEPLDLWDDGEPIIPFAAFRPFEDLDTWYPIPPMFNWVSPQDELNETREMMRQYRRKLIAKYYATVGVTDDELAKFLEPVMQVVKVSKSDDIGPIANPPADAALLRALPATNEDFREISGTSGEQRGVAEADTATQASIIDQNTKVRESSNRVKVAEWLAEIAKLMMITIERRMALPFWIQTNVDLMSPNAAAEAGAIAMTWQQITTADLGSLDYDVTVDVESIAPTTESQERNAWIQVLQVLQQPGAMLILSNPILLRKTLGYFGIKNEKEIQAIQQYAAAFLMMQAQAAAAQPAGGTKEGGEPGSEAPPEPAGPVM